MGWAVTLIYLQARAAPLAIGESQPRGFLLKKYAHVPLHRHSKVASLLFLLNQRHPTKTT